MAKKRSYSGIVVLAVLSLLFFAPKGVLADTQVTLTITDPTYGCIGWPVGSMTTGAQDSYATFKGHDFTGVGSIDYYGGTGSGGHFPTTYSHCPNNDNVDGFGWLSAYLPSYGGTWAAGDYGMYVSIGGNVYYGYFVVGAGNSWINYTPPPATTEITSISPQITDPFTQTATTSVTYYITPADLAAGTTTMNYVITTQDSIGYNPAQIGTVVATSSGSHTDTFYMGAGQAAWSAFYTLNGVAGEDPNIGAFYSIATSTFWVNGTSTLLNITTATSTGTTTNGASLQQCKSNSLIDFSYFACVIGNRFSDVFQWLFIPPQGSFNEYQNMKITVETKAPFGYFFLIRNAISGINASSTSTFTLILDQGVLASIITPIRTALSWILLMGFGFWFYMRMKHLDIW